MKCPSSCTKTRTPRTNANAKRVVTYKDSVVTYKDSAISCPNSPLGGRRGSELDFTVSAAGESLANEFASVRTGSLIDLTNGLERAHGCREMRVHALRDHAGNVRKAQPSL